MEEFIGFGLVALFITGLVLTIRKVFTKKKDLYEYEDEIILDNDMVHYGPFSGSPKNPCRKLSLLLAVSSSFLSADIEFRTIDNWGINSWGQEALILQKTSDDHQGWGSLPKLTASMSGSSGRQADRVRKSRNAMIL